MIKKKLPGKVVRSNSESKKKDKIIVKKKLIEKKKLPTEDKGQQW